MERHYINYSHGNSWDDQCKKYPMLPDILPPAKRIIALGDTHGDIEVALKSLKLAKVINYDDDHINKITIHDTFDWIQWTASPQNTIVVQVGDQIDSCRPNGDLSEGNCLKDTLPDIIVFKLFDKLNEIAKEKGGAVYSLLGNHEIMNVQGKMGYVAKSGFTYFDEKDGYNKRKELFQPGNEYAKYLACTRQTGLIIGSNLFVHAGILPELAKQYNIMEINSLIRKWLLKSVTEDKKTKIGTINDLLENYKYSPFWSRLFGDLPTNLNINDNKCTDLMETMDMYKVGSMIVGHTPQFFKNKAGINNTCVSNDKQIWRIDIGAATAFDIFSDSDDENRHIQVLEILNDTDYKIIKG